MIKDLQPFNVVQNDGFKALIVGGYPFYKLCSRQYYEYDWKF